MVFYSARGKRGRWPREGRGSPSRKLQAFRLNSNQSSLTFDCFMYWNSTNDSIIRHLNFFKKIKWSNKWLFQNIARSPRELTKSPSAQITDHEIWKGLRIIQIPWRQQLWSVSGKCRRSHWIYPLPSRPWLPQRKKLAQCLACSRWSKSICRTNKGKNQGWPSLSWVRKTKLRVVKVLAQSHTLKAKVKLGEDSRALPTGSCHVDS